LGLPAVDGAANRKRGGKGFAVIRRVADWKAFGAPAEVRPGRRGAPVGHRPPPPSDRTHPPAGVWRSLIHHANLSVSTWSRAPAMQSAAPTGPAREVADQ